MKQSPDFYFKEQIAFLNNGGAIENCTSTFLTPFQAEINKPTCIYVDDQIFNLLHEQNQLNWSKDSTLWVPPKADYIDEVPVGFSSLYDKSIQLLKTVSSSLLDEIKLIVCSRSQKHLHISILPSQPFEIAKNCDYDLLILFLNENQYENVDLVVEAFQYSIRGAIVDFFPPTSGRPVRVSFYGDDVILHAFDINSQTTINSLSSCKISTNSVGFLHIREQFLLLL